MYMRTALYLALWVCVLSHTVVNKTLTQITLIDDVKRTAEHVIDLADQSAHSNHVIEQINVTQFNATQGNLTALCLRCSPGEYSTGAWCIIIIVIIKLTRLNSKLQRIAPTNS